MFIRIDLIVKGDMKMDIKQQVDMLLCFDHKQAYQVLKELLVMSEVSDQVYFYYDQFMNMMRNESNAYIRTRGLRLLAYNAKWDDANKLNGIIHEYLKHMEDEKPITSRQCIKDVVIIAKYKPELIDVILASLETINKIYEESMQHLIYKDRQKAIRQIRQFTW